MGGGKKADQAASSEASQARADEQARQNCIRAGTQRIDQMFYGGPSGKGGQFDDNFFNKRSQAYINYATPQLEDQRDKAQSELAFSLARSGNLDSSVRAQKEADLAKLFSLGRQDVADKGLAYANEARSNVEQARSDLISMLNASGDDTAAVNSALHRASALSQPAAFSPLSQIFADFTAGLGQQAALERASYYSGGAVAPKYNTGLFAPRPGSVVVR